MQMPGDNRHGGHLHHYSIFFIGGNEGFQFNKVRMDAKARAVSIVKSKIDAPWAWQAGSGTSGSWETTGDGQSGWGSRTL
jgi:hypothetical protein